MDHDVCPRQPHRGEEGTDRALGTPSPPTRETLCEQGEPVQLLRFPWNKATPAMLVETGAISLERAPPRASAQIESCRNAGIECF